MKKILFSMFAIFCLVLPLSLGLVGCDDDDIFSKQITMVQIEKTLDAKNKQGWMPKVEDVTATEFGKVAEIGNISQEMLEWQRNFERQNVDTENFMALDEYYYNASGSHYVVVFKFSDKEDARECTQKYDFKLEKYNAKQYGNLVVACNISLGNQIFNIIDAIK